MTTAVASNNTFQMTMTYAVLCAFVFLTAFIGAALGSFLNVVIWRVPEGMSLVSPPSHCPKCGSPVRWYDNVPILSWFVLRGRCRDCRNPISIRYPMVEAFSCLIAFVVVVAVFFGGWTGLKSSPLCWTGYCDFMESRGAALMTNVFSQASSDAASAVWPDFTSYIVDEFIRLLFATVGLSLFYTILADSALMLGFVQYDRNDIPSSLLVTGFVVIVLGAFVVKGFNSSDFELQINQIKLFLLSCALGAIPSVLVKKGFRLATSLLGMIWGVFSGALWAFPGAFLCVLISAIVRKKTNRNVLGIVVYAAMALTLLFEMIYSFVA